MVSHDRVDIARTFSINLFPELSIAPELNNQLVPQHVRTSLAAQGLDVDNFTPLTKDEMMARLD